MPSAHSIECRSCSMVRFCLRAGTYSKGSCQLTRSTAALRFLQEPLNLLPCTQNAYWCFHRKTSRVSPGRQRYGVWLEATACANGETFGTKNELLRGTQRRRWRDLSSSLAAGKTYTEHWCSWAYLSDCCMRFMFGSPPQVPEPNLSSNSIHAQYLGTRGARCVLTKK